MIFTQNGEGTVKWFVKEYSDKYSVVETVRICQAKINGA